MDTSAKRGARFEFGDKVGYKVPVEYPEGLDLAGHFTRDYGLDLDGVPRPATPEERGASNERPGDPQILKLPGQALTHDSKTGRITVSGESAPEQVRKALQKTDSPAPTLDAGGWPISDYEGWDDETDPANEWFLGPPNSGPRGDGYIPVWKE